MRFLHLMVVAVLVIAAAHVYRIKLESTVQEERVARLRGEIRHERDAIASLRAQWAQLDNPARIEALAARHLPLRPIDPAQIDSLDHLPERPAASPTPDTPATAPPGDTVADVLDSLDSDPPTGSIGGIEIMPPATATDEPR
jgi:hypothetical protein